ncbi:hypothetical protein GW17_00029310 [Ensete ventricosum]|nr:hypothetical protein GW17_00029310 [Ensete ventricosum]RZR95019.1 hypothetical protein BHM03_00023792 [Ensete ventricosum]
MGWGRKESGSSPMLNRLLSGKEVWAEEKIPKGYVPMLVGDEEDQAERFLVHVKLLNDRRFVALMEMAAGEFGYNQQGIIRMPCNAQHFQRMVDGISKTR